MEILRSSLRGVRPAVVGGVMLLALATAALADIEKSLVGTWVGRMMGMEVALQLNSDGSADFIGTPGRWRVQGNTLQFVDDQQEEWTFSYQLAGGRLTLSGEDFEEPLVFSRAGGAEAPSMNPDPGDDASDDTARSAAATMPGDSFSDEYLGISLKIPANWSVLKQQNSELVLGSKTEMGIIIVRLLGDYTLQRLQQDLSVPIQLEGLSLSSTQAPKPFTAQGATGLAGEASGTSSSGPARSRVVGLLGPHGNAVTVLGIVVTQAYPDMKARVDAMSTSVRFTKPKPSDALRFLVGNYTSYTSSGAFSSGSSSTLKLLNLRVDGTFDMGGESSFSATNRDMGGDITSQGSGVSTSASSGRWTARGNAQRGTLVLMFLDGSRLEWAYEVSTDPRDTGGNGPGYMFDGRKYVR